MSEGYDIRSHLPQQLEFFLNGFASGNVEAMERAKNNILDIYGNTDQKQVVDNISEWDKKKKQEIELLWDKALKGLKTVIDTKKHEELFIDWAEIQKDIAEALNELETEYWESIRGLLIKSISQ